MSSTGLTDFDLTITGNQDINADNIYADNIYINTTPNLTNVGSELISLQSQIDAIETTLITDTTIGWWGTFWSLTTQTNIATTNKVSFTYYDPSNNGVILDTSTGTPYTRLKILNKGVYNLQFSLQLDHSSSSTNDVYIFFSVNGTPMGDSSGLISMKNLNDHIVPAWNYVNTYNANDYIEINWYSAQSTTELTAFSSQTISGNTIPAIPSAIVTITQVSNTDTAKDVIFQVVGTNTLPAGSTNYVLDNVTDFGTYVNHDLTFGLAKGDQGIQGIQGATGATGAQGPQGTQGIQGAQGPQGIQGPQGATGPTGPQGLQGNGGIQGQNGNDGQSIALQVVNTITIGSGNNAYVNDNITTSGNITTHSLTFGIPQGEKGAKGDQGEKGAKGDQGDQGAKGDQGPAGQNGDATAATASAAVAAGAATAAAASAATAITTANTALGVANSTAASLAATNANVTSLQSRMTIVEDKTAVLEFDLIDQIIKAPLSIQDVTSSQHVYLSNNASVDSNIDSNLELGKELIVNGNISANANLTCQSTITSFGTIKSRASTGNNKNVSLENNISGTSINFLSAVTGGQQRDAGIDVTAPVSNGTNDTGTLSISAGQTNINSTLAINNNTTLTGNLTQTGNTTITGNLSAIGAGSMVINSPSVTIGGSGSVISIGDSIANTSITTIYGVLIAPFGVSVPSGSFFSQF